MDGQLGRCSIPSCCCYCAGRVGCGTQNKHTVTHTHSHMQTPFAASWVLLAYKQGNKQSEGMQRHTRAWRSAESHPAPRTHDLCFCYCTDRQRQGKKKVLPDFSSPATKQESQLLNVFVVSPLSFKERSLQVGQVQYLQRE